MLFGFSPHAMDFGSGGGRCRGGCIQRLASGIANQTGLSSESWKWTGGERERWKMERKGKGMGEREGERGGEGDPFSDRDRKEWREGGREEEMEEGIERNRGGGSRRENE